MCFYEKEIHELKNYNISHTEDNEKGKTHY